MFFDDESAEVVISSLRLGEEQDRCVEPVFFFFFSFPLFIGGGCMFCSECDSHGW